MSDDLLQPSEAAALCRCTEAQLRKWRGRPCPVFDGQRLRAYPNGRGAFAYRRRDIETIAAVPDRRHVIEDVTDGRLYAVALASKRFRIPRTTIELYGNGKGALESVPRITPVRRLTRAPGRGGFRETELYPAAWLKHLQEALHRNAKPSGSPFELTAAEAHDRFHFRSTPKSTKILLVELANAGLLKSRLVHQAGGKRNCNRKVRVYDLEGLESEHRRRLGDRSTSIAEVEQERTKDADVTPGLEKSSPLEPKKKRPGRRKGWRDGVAKVRDQKMIQEWKDGVHKTVTALGRAFHLSRARARQILLEAGALV